MRVSKTATETLETINDFLKGKVAYLKGELNFWENGSGKYNNAQARLYEVNDILLFIKKLSSKEGKDK